jgi:hypothetical protein
MTLKGSKKKTEMSCLHIFMPSDFIDVRVTLEKVHCCDDSLHTVSQTKTVDIIDELGELLEVSVLARYREGGTGYWIRLQCSRTEQNFQEFSLKCLLLSLQAR